MRNRSMLPLILFMATALACGSALAKLKAVPGATAASAAASQPKVPVKLVDINSAGADELKSLPGIGDVEAARIIAGRPYRSKAWLVTKKVIPEPTFHALKGRVVASQKDLPKVRPR